MDAEIRMQQNPAPDHLYKILSVEQWNEIVATKQFTPSRQDKDFIHLAKEDQVAKVIQKFWNTNPCILLKLDRKKLKGDLVYETNPGGSTRYYHLYDGTIPFDAVLASELFSKE